MTTASNPADDEGELATVPGSAVLNSPGLASSPAVNPAAILLRTVLARGPLARGAIARLTGLSPAGVSRQCASLAGLGLLTERTSIESTGRRSAGRPHIEVDIATDRHVVLGVHIAHEFGTVAVLDLRGKILAQQRIPHVDRNPDAVLTVLAARVRELAARIDGRGLLGLGVACGGWVDPDRGMIVAHSSLRWADVPAGRVLAELTGLPTKVDSHARALAAAEAMFGAWRGRGCVVHLFVGNVVDAAISSGGRSHRGPGSLAGTVAHLPFGAPDVPCSCGRSGCLEQDVADWAIINRVFNNDTNNATNDAASTSELSIVDVVLAAGTGDSRAKAALLRRAHTVGRVVALLLDVLNPDVLVVTEPGVANLPECLAVLHERVAVESQVCADPTDRVVPSSFDSTEVLGVAAGAVQLDALYTDPHAFSERLAPARVSTGATKDASTNSNVIATTTATTAVTSNMGVTHA